MFVIKPRSENDRVSESEMGEEENKVEKGGAINCC